MVEPNLRTPPTSRRGHRRVCYWSRVGSARGRRVRHIGRHTHLILSVYWRITLVPVPPHGVKVNRAVTRSRPTCLRILIPALVGLSVIVVVPAEATSRTDHFSFPADPSTGRTTNLPAPATATLTVNVPVLVSAVPFEATVNLPPALMSLTITVPASVPSDFHSSRHAKGSLGPPTDSCPGTCAGVT